MISGVHILPMHKTKHTVIPWPSNRTRRKGGGIATQSSSSQQAIDGDDHVDTPAPIIKKKLTFQEKFEFEALGGEIVILEKRVEEINFIFQHETVGGDDMKKLGKEMDTLTKALGEKEARWLELCERG